MSPVQASVRDSAVDPFITIAIPTFNRAAWLRGCLVSALGQTYQNFEVLVSDNASTDETSELLKEFVDLRIRVVRQKTNIGLIGNWNASLAAAKGRYVVFVSDDDRIAPWMLERCIALIKRAPEIPIVIALSDLRSAALDRTWPGRPSRRLTTGIWDGSDILLEYLRDQIGITMCSILLRTEALRSTGGFPIDFHFAGDVAAWSPLLFTGKAGLINESCATYNLHSGSETSKSGVESLLLDGWKVVDLISRNADRSVGNLVERRGIKQEARRCFARRAVLILSQYRQEGGQRAEILSLVWQFRRNFIHIGMGNILRLARPIAIILLHESTVDRIRHFKRTWVGRLGWVQNR